MLTEKELQEIRTEVETSIKTGSGMVLAGIASKLLDYIDSLPKPPQVFGEISEEELRKAEELLSFHPERWMRVSDSRGDPTNCSDLVVDDDIILLLSISSRADRSKSQRCLLLLQLICYALPKLLATIRTQAALLRDLQEDSAAAREAICLREKAERYWEAMSQARRIAEFDGTYEGIECLIEWMEKEKINRKALEDHPHD